MMVKKVSKPKVSTEEQEYRKGLYPEVADIKNKNVLCTSCNSSVKELVIKGKPIAHPFLETLLCEKCDNFFGDGQFSVDEDGSDKYCRWCGQGGTLFLCSTCTAGFCKKCIKRNLPRSALNEVDDDNWMCYCCNVKPLYDLRANCWAAQEYAGLIKKRPNENLKKRKANDSSEEDEYNGERRIQKKANMLSVGESNVNKKEKKKHIKAGAAKLSDFLADTVTMIELVKKKGIEYKTKKASTRSLKSVESVLEFASKVGTMLENVEKSSMKMRENLNNYIDSWKKAVEEDTSGINENKEMDTEDGSFHEKNQDVNSEGYSGETNKNGEETGEEPEKGEETGEEPEKGEGAGEEPEKGEGAGEEPEKEEKDQTIAEDRNEEDEVAKVGELDLKNSSDDDENETHEEHVGEVKSDSKGEELEEIEKGNNLNTREISGVEGSEDVKEKENKEAHKEEGSCSMISQDSIYDESTVLFHRSEDFDSETEKMETV